MENCIKKNQTYFAIDLHNWYFNPFFDRNVLLTMGGVKITGGENFYGDTDD